VVKQAAASLDGTFRPLSFPGGEEGAAMSAAARGAKRAKGTDDQRRAWRAAACVPDPEVPCVTVADLGILRSVEFVDGIAVAKVTPTYSGCPAVLAIELAIEAALLDAGFTARIERVLSPAWTTDWITEEGRQKLRAYGIAPPVGGSNSIRSLFGETVVACPRCGSDETERVSEFSSTACKALYRCTRCREPFDYFKCI
jgi:ring-1,2-phenylacetyl-CoA epoxidase subunit PaaD